MICAVLVIVPGDGVAWSQCKNPCQDIAAFQHGLDVFDFVRIGCGHNDVLPITFKQISASTLPPLALTHGAVRFGSKADIGGAGREVCFVPKADSCTAQLTVKSSHTSRGSRQISPPKLVAHFCFFKGNVDPIGSGGQGYRPRAEHATGLAAYFGGFSGSRRWGRGEELEEDAPRCKPVVVSEKAEDEAYPEHDDAEQKRIDDGAIGYLSLMLATIMGPKIPAADHAVRMTP